MSKRTKKGWTVVDRKGNLAIPAVYSTRRVAVMLAGSFDVSARRFGEPYKAVHAIITWSIK